MRFARALVATLAVVSTAAGGCAHEHLPWPPPQSEIDRINQASRKERDWLRVEYVEPTAAKVVRPIRIESIDDDDITFRTKAGESERVPSLLVQGVTVKDRYRGGLLGAAAGVGAMAAALGAAAFVAGTEPFGDDPCRCDARGFAAGFALTAAVGAVIGLVISGRRTFHFDRVDRAS
jgi:hypothetical protein